MKRPTPIAGPQVTLRSVDYATEVDHLHNRLLRLDAAIDQAVQQAPESLRAVIDALQALRGVSKLTAVTIATEVGTLSRFEHPREANLAHFRPYFAQFTDSILCVLVPTALKIAAGFALQKPDPVALPIRRDLIASCRAALEVIKVGSMAEELAALRGLIMERIPDAARLLGEKHGSVV